MPTQEEQLGLISDASLLQTQAVLDLKASLTSLVNTTVANFEQTITRVNNLNQVDNVSDLDKPISNLALAALATKQVTLVDGDTISTVNGVSLLSGVPLVVQRSATSLVSLSYETRGTLRTPIIPLPEPDDSVVIEGLGLFMYVLGSEEPDDDETCFTLVDPISSLPIGQWLLRVLAFEIQNVHLHIELQQIKEYTETNPQY